MICTVYHNDVYQTYKPTLISPACRGNKAESLYVFPLPLENELFDVYNDVTREQVHKFRW